MNVTVVFDLKSALSEVHPYSVAVTVFPPAIMVNNHTHAELTLSFNTRYNISFTSTFCGFNSESDTIQLLYGESKLTMTYSYIKRNYADWIGTCHNNYLAKLLFTVFTQYTLLIPIPTFNILSN